MVSVREHLRLASCLVLAALLVLVLLARPGAPARAAPLDAAADRVIGQANFTSGNAGLTAARLNNPGGVAVDATSGRIYVADSTNRRVLSWPNAAGLSNGQAADLVIGQNVFTSSNSLGTAPHAGNFSLPVAVAVDTAGNLYVADAGFHRVLRFSAPISSSGISATLVLGQPDFTSSQPNRGGGPAANTLHIPFGVAVDAAGNVYVADAGNNRVLRYAAPLGTNGPDAVQVFGQLDSFTTNLPNNGGRSAATLLAPAGVAVDGQGRLWVADQGNNRVLMYQDPLTTDTVADLVIGQADFTLGTAALSAGALSGPRGVVVDAAGQLYVADSDNNRVLQFNAPFENGQSANRVLGQPNFTAGLPNNDGLSASSLNQPVGLAVDSARNLYVADRQNHRVLGYDQIVPDNPPQITGLSPSPVIAGSGATTLVVDGANFVAASPGISGSVLTFNGGNRSTSVLSSTRLLAQLSTSDVRNAGSALIRINNPLASGGSSNSVTLAIHNAIPSISGFSPPTAPAGGVNFNLTVNGTGFAGTTQVWWNGTIKTTTYISSTQVRAAIPPADLTAPGTASVMVVNPPPGGGQTATVSIDIVYARPVINSLQPNAVPQNAGEWTLTVNGANFVNNASQVAIGGQVRSTTYISSSQLLAAMLPADTAVTGTKQIIVINPPPGGTSAVASLRVGSIPRLWLPFTRHH